MLDQAEHGSEWKQSSQISMPNTDFYGRIHSCIQWADPTDSWKVEDPPLLLILLGSFDAMPAVCKP